MTSVAANLLETANTSPHDSVSERGSDLESSAFPATTAAARAMEQAPEADPGFQVACLAGQSYARPDDRTAEAKWLQSFINNECGDSHAFATSASHQAPVGEADLDPHSSESSHRTAACVADYSAMNPGSSTASSNSSDAFCRCRPLLLLRLRQARQLFNMLSLGPAGLCLLLLLGTRFLLRAKKAYTRIG